MPDYVIKDGNSVSQTITVPTLGQKAMAGSQPVALASDQSTVPVSVPGATSVAAISLTTAASFTAFSSQTCKSLNVANATGTTIEYQRGGSGPAFPIFDGTSALIVGVTNANQIGFRRKDAGSTSVTVVAEAIS